MSNSLYLVQDRHCIRSDLSTDCSQMLNPLFSVYIHQGFFQQFWEKAPGHNWEKMIDLTSKLGEINDIEHNKGSKIYPHNKLYYAKHTT